MRILITGVCGFAGSTLARTWRERGADHTLFGIDNLSRAGSERNRLALRRLGVTVTHADLRLPSDFESLPAVDWVIDAAANPSVLAGIDGRTSSRQLVEHNLYGTVNMLEFCKRSRAGFILLSTSRVYSVEALSSMPIEVEGDAFRPAASPPPGASAAGIDETFSTAPPLSLYGSSKRASEQLAIEYAAAFGCPVWINRCGVLAGAGQFGRSDQGIFSYWIHGWARRRPLSYIGFGGSGHQVRDCLHPRDLVSLLDWQLSHQTPPDRCTFNVSGGAAAAISLKALSTWCAGRFGPHAVATIPTPRPYDVPWLVLDATRVERYCGWRPETTRETILEEIAAHAEAHPSWFEMTDA